MTPSQLSEARRKLGPTPQVDWFAIPENAIWCIGQHTKAERTSLDRNARKGTLIKVRARWQGISPFKTVFIPAHP